MYRVSKKKIVQLGQSVAAFEVNKNIGEMKPILLSQMNYWLLNVVYFSQYGCCNPER